MNFRLTISLVLVSIFFTACATVYESEGITGIHDPQVTPPSDRREGGSRTQVYKDYLPFIEIDTWGLEYSTQNDFYDKYTRIFIVPDFTRIGCPASQNDENCARLKSELLSASKEERNYSDESRSWLARWLVGKTVSQAFVTTFSLNKGETKFSSELFSLSFDSNNVEGETWSTSQSLNTVVSPYFKIGAGDTLGMTATLNLSENNKSEISANVVSALATAATAIAPQSSLVTTLSSDRISKASSFLDDNISALFDQSISESLKTDIQLEKYCDSAGFISEIELNLPEVNRIKSTTEKARVGKWFVYLESPIDSIFTKEFESKIECNGNSQLREWSTPDFTRLQAGDILEFKVGDDLTIYDFVFSRLELTDLIKVINEKASENTTDAAKESNEAARSICARLERKLPELGLNTYDTAATLWATANSDQFKIKARDLLLDDNTCITAKRWNSIEKKPDIVSANAQ